MKKLILTICIVLSIVTASFCLVGCNTENNVESEVHNIDVTIGDDVAYNRGSLDFEEIVPSIKLAEAQSADGISKILIATVYPEDTTQNLVDWSIEWNENTPLYGSNVDEYLTLTVASDGAREATITCYKSFEGSTAKVTVTTCHGGYKAYCTVSYAGAPKFLGASFDGATQNGLYGYDVTIGNYTGELYLKNDLGTSIDGSNAIGSVYGNYTIERVYAKVKYYVTAQYKQNGTVVFSEDYLIDTTDNSFGNSCTINVPAVANYTDEGISFTVNADTFASVSLNGSTLSVDINKTQGSCLYGSLQNRTGWVVVFKEAYVVQGNSADNTICVHYKENVSGLDAIVEFKMNVDATGVALNSNNVEF